MIIKKLRIIKTTLLQMSPDGQGRPDGEHQPGWLASKQSHTLPLCSTEAQETHLTQQTHEMSTLLNDINQQSKGPDQEVTISICLCVYSCLSVCEIFKFAFLGKFLAYDRIVR